MIPIVYNTRLTDNPSEGFRLCIIRLGNDWGNHFGSLSANLALADIAQRAVPGRA